ncbi:hypothetical protein PC112_g7867 [Phytophthora cactorum]|nr:hypothetical protein PC112_g7867 [Phytophthora cactorum]
MEGIRVFIPDEKLVWVPATVLSVDATGKVFRVRVQPLTDVSDATAGHDQDAPAEERTIDLNEDGMPDSLPLQNGPAEGDEDEANTKHSVGAEDMCELGHLHEPAIVYNAAGERNYHIFYQLVSAKEDVFGFNDDTSAKEFRYLQDEKLILDGKTDLERYQVTRDALSTIGLSDKEQTELFSSLCGILRLGQLDFVPLESNKDDASQAVASLNASSPSGSVTAEQIEQQKKEIDQCAKLLGVEVAALSKQLCSRTVKARQEVYCVPLSAHHAGNNRDALAKEIYARVFGYLLRCAGVVEAIRITRAAFPNKMAHEKFLRRFVMMRSKKDATLAKESTTVAEACEQLAEELLSGDAFARTQEGSEHSRTPTFVVGKSLVYFGKDVLEFLEHRRTTFVHDRAIMIQQAARRWMARRRIKKVRAVISKIQALHRCRMQRQSYLEKRRKCIIVQSVWRGVRSRQRVYLMMKEKSAIKVQTAYRKHLSEKKYAKFRSAVIKIQSNLKMKKQVGKYQRLLSERKEQDAMETEVELLKHRLEDEKRARMEIEAENSSLQQELNQVRNSSVPSASSSIYENEAPPQYRNSMRSSRIERESMDDGKLLDDSERMIDYLRKEVTKGRELIQMLSQENENLKAENKKIKDAYTAAGASFAALNQHNKQQSKANLRLMSTHAALIKSQEEKMKKYKKQVAELKEDLRMQRSVYSAELKARVQQQDLLLDIINLAESDGVSEDLLERMRAMAVDSKPSYDNGRRSSEFINRRSSVASKVTRESEHREHRSDTATSMGPVPVSVSVSANPSRTERRATLDTIMNNPVQRGVSPHAEGMSPPDRGSLNRNSLNGEDGPRKSRIGGMFKKMFKKDE